MDNKEKRFLYIILIYVIMFAAFLLIKKKKANLNLSQQLDLSQNTNGSLVEIENAGVSDEIYVHISGEVHYPGLVKLEKGQRLFEAIEIAGGMTDMADVNQINLSIILSDEDKIYIPKKGENSEFLTTNSQPLININTGSKEELMTLTGIGEKTAESIIEYRSKNRFEKIEDLKKVNGIGDQKFENIKDKITI